MVTTFGIEEEFVILDPATLLPVDCAPAFTAIEQRGGRVAHEFFPSQIEFASPAFTDSREALESLLGFRRRLGRWAASAGLVAAGSGTPFRTGPHSAVTTGERYARIAADVAGITAEHQINGLHVHVGIPDREAGVRASNALRPWLPVLLAMSANSPFWQGSNTGFESWRAIHSRRWTTYGIPPRFRDATDYDTALRALAGIGATTDPGTINWNVRLSDAYPTVEVRVFDAQLDPWSTLALAIITRALVERAEEPPPPRCFDVTDAALWHAARHGVTTTLVHPLDGRVARARDVLQALRDQLALDSMTSWEQQCVDDLFGRLNRGETGAALQRQASLDRATGLAELYRRQLSALSVRGAVMDSRQYVRD